jgi:TetR/AcrR family transcriptional regulator
MTQSYADFGTQMALVLGRKLTRKDFDDAEEMIVNMVLCAVALSPREK